MLRFVVFATIFSLSSLAAADKNEENCPRGKKHYRAAIRHIESGGIGYDQGYTTLEAFLASDPNLRTITPFLDARGHVFDNGKWALNAGVGVRALWGNRTYGINTYYDYRNTGRFHSNQIGVGLETFGELCDFRINGYLPVGAKVSAPYDSTFKTFSGHYMLLSEKIQSAMKGANAEFGFHFGKSEALHFYAAAGPYYFIGENAPSTWGGKARISGTFKDTLALEISDSYDRTFNNKFQGQISLSFSFGPKSKVKERGRTCKVANTLNNRMLQPVDRQEIIVIDNTRKNAPAIDPATGLPYFFVFVDNTASSDGTYASPFHSLAQAQDNSSPNDIIYVFPGDGTTAGMDKGILLQANQKFWGSGISHSLQTSQGTISIPAQSSSSPTITNTDADTEGYAIILANDNAISGFTITSSLTDAIYGTNLQNLEVSSCSFQQTTVFPIHAIFSGTSSVSLTNNQFVSHNANGIALVFNESSTVVCSGNTFEDQDSVSNSPLDIVANGNTLVAQIENNFFNHNRTGSISFHLNEVVNADISVLNNTITNNRAGFVGTSGSSFVVASTGTNDRCSIVLKDNTFSNNESYALFLHTSGAFTTLDVTASTNTISGGSSALVLATPVDTFTLLVEDNIITACNDNAIALISSGSTTTGAITMQHNTITDVGNGSSGIAISQDFSTLNLTLLNNEINGCEGTGISAYPSTGIDLLTLNISENIISHCLNLSSNAASALNIQQYTNLEGSITNNLLSDNADTPVAIGSTLPTPTVCLTLTDNENSGDYSLVNPGDGVFHLSPCNVDAVNTGTINTSGTIDLVQSCPEGTPCGP